jgi:hypothetical protein
MDVQAVTSIITTVGFPIAVCLICFWYINKMQEQHKVETDKLAEALNNNTLVIQKLINNLENKGGTT